MAETKLVKDQAVEGERLLRRLQEEGVDIATAFWFLGSEKEDWALFIVLKDNEHATRLAAHQKIRKAFEDLPDLWLEPSEVRLLAGTDRLAREIATIRPRQPQRLKDRYHVNLGGFSSGEVHIYPLPAMP